jgi:hypothetical protein
MGACWTHEGSAYTTKDTTKIPYYPSRGLGKQFEMFKRECSVPTERTTSSHGPLGIKNTKGEPEAQKAPSLGQLGFPRRGRGIRIKAIRGEKIWRLRMRAKLQTGCVI